MSRIEFEMVPFKFSHFDYNQTVFDQACDCFTVPSAAIMKPVQNFVFFSQAVGHCDGSDVNTEMFRISHHTKDGQLIKTEYVKHGELI